MCCLKQEKDKNKVSFDGTVLFVCFLSKEAVEIIKRIVDDNTGSNSKRCRHLLYTSTETITLDVLEDNHLPILELRQCGENPRGSIPTLKGVPTSNHPLNWVLSEPCTTELIIFRRSTNIYGELSKPVGTSAGPLKDWSKKKTKTETKRERQTCRHPFPVWCLRNWLPILTRFYSIFQGVGAYPMMLLSESI